MKNRKSVIIGITSLMLVTLILLGLTYAYYRTRIIGNNSEEPSISVTSKKMEITYHDGSATLSTEGEIEPGFSATKAFSIENTGNESMSIGIIVDNVENTYRRNSDWTYKLTGDGINETTGVFPTGENYLVRSVNIPAGETYEYTLEVKYAKLDDVNQSEDMGKTLTFRVNIDEEGMTWDTAKEGTLLYSLKNNNSVTTGDNGLSTSEDDYGTSYYFKGDVSNNYVNYAGMCWRVLRVQGNGGIKLILADSNNECDSNDYNKENPSAFVDNNSSLGELYVREEYPGTSQLEYKTSRIPLLLDTWMNGGNYTLSNITFEKHINEIEQEKLLTAEWCNDLSIDNIVETNYYCVDKNGEEVNCETQKNLVAITTREILTKYSGQIRLEGEEKNPTLKCDMRGINGSKAEIINSKIGIATADELFLASNNYIDQTKPLWIDDNADTFENDVYDATMTPYQHNLDQQYVGFTNEVHEEDIDEGYIINRRSISTFEGKVVLDNLYGVSYFINNVRPMVVLKSYVLAETKDVQTNGQVGTSTNPYIVK